MREGSAIGINFPSIFGSGQPTITYMTGLTVLTFTRVRVSVHRNNSEFNPHWVPKYGGLLYNILLYDFWFLCNVRVWQKVVFENITLQIYINGMELLSFALRYRIAIGWNSSCPKLMELTILGCICDQTFSNISQHAF